MRPLASVKARGTAVRRALRRWFRRDARDLPWRRRPEPYRVWLSEIMLQQTRVEAVVPYYRAFLKRFPNVRALARAPLDDVLQAWAGLGYYGRARNLHRAARAIVRTRGGRFPRTADGWHALPGVGRYTAGAIASIAFGERAAVVDGNVKRVLARLFCVRRSVDAPATEAFLWGAAEILVPPVRPGEFNQALMELGARVCTPRRPRCPRCPLRNLCDGRRAGVQATLPVRRAKKSTPHVEVVAAVLEEKGRFLLGRRPAEGMLGGMWELPGGRVEKGEGRRRALARELREELGIDAEAGARLARVEHAYSHFSITLHVYGCRRWTGRPRKHFHTALRWVRPADLGRYAVPAATKKALEKVACMTGDCP